MSFSLTNTLGWALFEVFTSAQANDLDLKTSRALDGHAGGVYAPSSPIEIGGAGLVVTGTLGIEGDVSFNNPVAFNDDVDFNDPVAFNDDLEANGAATFNDPVEINDDLTVNADATITGVLTVQGDLSVDDDLFVDDDCQVGGDLDVAGTFTLAGTAELNGDVAIGSSGSDAMSFHASLTNFLRYTGSGRIPYRSGGTLPNSSVTLDITDGQVFRINMAATGIRTYTLSTSSAQDGDWMLFWTGPGNSSIPPFDMVISAAGDTNGYTFVDSRNSQWVKYIFLDGAWYRMNFGGE